jgi:hypothetical protein
MLKIRFSRLVDGKAFFRRTRPLRPGLLQTSVSITHSYLPARTSLRYTVRWGSCPAAFLKARCFGPVKSFRGCQWNGNPSSQHKISNRISQQPTRKMAHPGVPHPESDAAGYLSVVNPRHRFRGGLHILRCISLIPGLENVCANCSSHG